MTHAKRSTAPQAAPLADTAETRLQARKPLKEVEAPGVFGFLDYFTDREGAIKRDRERTAYLQEIGQRAALEDIKTQTGFFDRLGDFFSKGLLSVTANIKDTQRGIETDPVLKKQFTEEARRFAADKGVEIADATTWESVKEDFLRNAIPFAIEQGAQSLPGMVAGAAPLPGLGISNIFGGQAREATELDGRQDVEFSDLVKVAPGALAVTALDQLGLGGIFAAPAKTALGRVGKAALLEGGTEAIQSAIEYANPRLVTGNAIDAGELFEQAAIGAFVGGTLGGGLRGATEAVAAPFRPKAEAADVDAPINAAVRQEFQKLAAQEVAAVMAADPTLSRDQAVNAVMERAEGISAQAADNIAQRAEGEADVVSDIDTGMDVIGGVGARVAPDFEPSAATTGATEFGEVIGGGLERPVSGVPIPDVGERAGVSPLEAAPATVEPAPKLAFDTTPIFEAKSLEDRKAAADMLISDVVQAVPELQGLDTKVYGTAARQIAQSAARGEQFDPLDVVYNVAGIEPAALEVAGPSIDEVAVAPVKAALEAAVAPTPAAGTIPTIAQASAQQLGITPTPEVIAPPEMVEPEMAAPEIPTAEPTPEMAAPEIPTVTPEMAAPEIPMPTVTPEMAAPEMAAPTPQEILADIESFAVPEAQDRGLDPDMFLAGVNDIRSDREPMNFFEFSEAYGFREPGEKPKFVIGPDPAFDSYTAYQSGAQFAQERVDEAQAATPAPVEAAPAVQEPVQAAMETAPESGTVPIDTATVDQVVSVKLTKAQIKKLEEAAGIRRMKLTNMQKRIVNSRNAEETLSLAGRLMLMARNRDKDVGLLSSLFNSVSPKVLQKLLGPLLTEDVVRLGERAGMKAPARIEALMRDEYIPYTNRIMQRAAKMADKWADFTSRFEKGALALADVMFVANMYNVDPSLAANATEYMQQDVKLQDLLAEQAEETDPKKKDTLKQQIATRRGQIQRVYYGGEMKTEAGKTATVYGWNDLSRSEFGSGAGKQIFRDARNEYQSTFDEHYRLLMERIDSAELEQEDVDRLKGAVDRMFAAARERIIYFPLKRFGEYWVSVGKGPAGEFHMFETASEQDAFLAQLRKDKDDRTISSGFGRDTLRNMASNQDASTALKGILDMIEDTGGTDIDLLKDHIFQMYLTALPEADMRQRFIHRQFKTGFSTDVLRTFASTAVSSANQLGRLAYGYQFKNAIDEGYAETEGNPSKRRLDTIMRELELRVNGTLAPEDSGGLDWLLSLGSKATFLFLLSSPKSAIMNLTQLHIVGLPTLSAEFGEKATYGMAARYTGSMLTGQRIANPFRDEEGNVRLQMPDFTLEGSAYIQGLRESDPERYAEIQKAWQYQAEHDVTESTFAAATDIYERSNRPTEKYSFTQAARKGDAITAAQRGTANAIEAMGTLFHHAERIGREIMYMSAFEMAYERNLKEGKDSEQAGLEARQLAAELTNKGMFDFSNWNKSRYSKHPAGRLPLQMRSYSVAMTSLLFRSFTNMIALQRTKAERLAAARVFMGVGAMTTLYGGFRVSQFYVMAMLGLGLYEFLKDMLGDEDEPEEEVEGGYLTEETIQRELMKYADEKGRELSKRDMEYYIRSAWIPETFGQGGTLATALGIEDANADKLAQAADMGIPAIFGVDISSSVSLGDLWHPVDTKSEDPEVRFYERLGRTVLGPSGALLTAPIKAVKEANAGNFDKAIEATMPAIIRNFVKAERLKDEGLVVGKNRDVVLKDPSFYDTYTLAMQSLGFAEPETSRAMQMDIKAGDIEREIAAEQTKLLDQRYRAILDFERNPTPDTEMARKKIERDITIYNLNYPSNEITEEDKEKSFQSKADLAAERAGGLGYNPKIPIRQNEAEERAARMLEGQ
jgi:hypothetical protein